MGSQTQGSKGERGIRELEGSEHLEAHLLGLLRVHSSHVLEMPQRVPLLLLLGPQVTPQCQQDALRLGKGRRLPGPAPDLLTPALCPRSSHT